MPEPHELLAERTSYPLHVGITEAGTVFSGTVKSSVGLGIILYQGIGDTIRVSLTGDPIEEVKAAKAILKDLGLKKGGIQVVSCPTCGRTQIDLIHLANQVEEMVADIPLNLTVAVMGCIVNGPGEAKEADLGIAGGKGEGLLIKKGKAVRKVPESELLSALRQELLNWGKTERAVRIKERIGCKSLFFRFSPTIQLKDETRERMEYASVSRVTVNRQKTQLHIYLESGRLIHKNISLKQSRPFMTSSFLMF